MAGLMVLMVAGVAMKYAKISLAASGAGVLHTKESFLTDFCFNGQTNKMSSSDIMRIYTKKTNDLFNTHIRNIMKNPDVEVPPVNFDTPESSAKIKSLCNKEDMTCQAIAACSLQVEDKNKVTSNDSAYCLAVMATGFTADNYSHYNKEVDTDMDVLKYSYFCYKAAMESKNNDVFDGTPQGLLKQCDKGGDKVSSLKISDICSLYEKVKEEADPVKKGQMEDELAKKIAGSSAIIPASPMADFWAGFKSGGSSILMGALDVTDKLTLGLTSTVGLSPDLADFANKSVRKQAFIESEIQKAKTALDQALDAYSRLQSAWKMHVGYVDVFELLVRYRDHLVAIRKQTDQFPFRFVDASTTKCL